MESRVKMRCAPCDHPSLVAQLQISKRRKFRTDAISLHAASWVSKTREPIIARPARVQRERCLELVAFPVCEAGLQRKRPWRCACPRPSSKVTAPARWWCVLCQTRGIQDNLKAAWSTPSLQDGSSRWRSQGLGKVEAIQQLQPFLPSAPKPTKVLLSVPASLFRIDSAFTDCNVFISGSCFSSFCFSHSRRPPGGLTV